MNVAVWRGIWRPNDYVHEWHGAAHFPFRKRWIAALILFSMVLSGIGGWFGAGREAWSGQFLTDASVLFTWQTIYFTLGSMVSGLLFAVFVLLGFGFMVWYASPELTFRSAVVSQLVPLSLFLIEKALLLVLFLWQGVPWQSSPFSLGVAAQFWFDESWWIYFFASITFFHIGVIVFHYKTLRAASPLKWWAAALILAALHLSWWVISATLGTLDFHALIGGL